MCENRNNRPRLLFEEIRYTFSVELISADANIAIEEKTEVQSKQRIRGKHEKHHGISLTPDWLKISDHKAKCNTITS